MTNERLKELEWDAKNKIVRKLSPEEFTELCCLAREAKRLREALVRLERIEAELSRFRQAEEIQMRRGWWAKKLELGWVAVFQNGRLTLVVGGVHGRNVYHPDPTTAILSAEKWYVEQGARK